MVATNIRGTQIADGSVSLTVDVTGTLPVGNGGSGAVSLTGVLKGNGTSAFTAATAGTDYLTPSGTENISGKTITFPGVSGASYAAGKLVYDTDNECLTFFNNDSNVAMQIGQENWVRVRNVTGSTIANGVPVYINGTDSGLPSVAPAKADAWNTSVAVGLTTESIATSSTGWVTVTGEVRGLDTSAYTAGSLVYVSAATAGVMTATAPNSPNYISVVGRVSVSNASTGRIHVLQTQPARAVGSRIGTTASTATPSIDCALYDQYNITALAANITSVTVSNAYDGCKLLVRITGTATRTIAWGTSFQSSGVATLLATTSGTNTHMVGFIYDSVKAKFVCQAVDSVGY
jgi:hypothetical protein